MKASITSNRKFNIGKRLMAPIVLVILWELASIVINQDILLPSPKIVFNSLIDIVLSKSFFNVVAYSCVKIILGFFIGLLLGLISGTLGYKFHIIHIFLEPVMRIIKATPVASFIILCLVWINSKNLGIFISFLMVMPIIYTNVYEGLISINKELLDMAKIFKISPVKKFIHLYLGEITTQILGGIKLSIGLCWKAGIAAEVIGIPKGSIGERLYEAKVYLETPKLFAWTIVIILLSLFFEKIFLKLVKLIWERVVWN